MKFLILLLTLFCGFAEARTPPSMNPIAQVIFDQHLDSEEWQRNFEQKMQLYISQQAKKWEEVQALKKVIDEKAARDDSERIFEEMLQWKKLLKEWTELSIALGTGGVACEDPDLFIALAKELQVRGTLPPKDIQMLERIAKICQSQPLIGE